MKAVVIYNAGGPDNLLLEERSIPVPGKDQVLVKIKAFGLNRSELMTRKGYSPNVKFPRVLGIECVGEIKIDPSGELSKGQKVAAFMGGMGRDFDGGYAEYAVLPKAIIAPFESDLPWGILGALPEMFQTVYGSLHLALRISEGERILVRGGTSSIGLLASQLAKINGLYVIASTRDPQKESLLLDNGADEVWIEDGNLSEMAQKSNLGKIDKVLELIGTPTLADSLRCVKPGGVVCMVGMLSEHWSVTEFTPMDYIPATVNLTIYDSGQIRVANNYFQNFLQQVKSGTVKPAIKKTFNLDQIIEAHSYMESNSGGGKIVVVV